MSNLASISGFIAIFLMLIQTALSNRFIITKININYPKLITFHTLLGIYSLFFILLHPFLQILVANQNIKYLFTLTPGIEYENYINLGKIGLILFLFIWITSGILKSKFSYNTWHLFHHLSYFSLLFIFIHSFKAGALINSYPFYKLIWIIFFIFFILVIILKLLDLLKINKAKFILIKAIKNKGKNYIYTFKSFTKRVNSQPGQFFYIGLKNTFASHPFSAMNTNHLRNELSFAIKTNGKFTQKLSELKYGDTVYIDGPYGKFTKEGQNNNPKVLLAGGVGIAPFVPLLKNYLNKDTYLFFSKKRKNDFPDNLLPLHKLGNRFIEVITEEGEKRQRIDKNMIEVNLSKDFLKKANFFICGGPKFTNSMLQILKDLKVNKKRIFTEEFSF